MTVGIKKIGKRKVLKKGYRYAKGGRVVKAKATRTRKRRK